MTTIGLLLCFIHNHRQPEDLTKSFLCLLVERRNTLSVFLDFQWLQRVLGNQRVACHSSVFIVMAYLFGADELAKACLASMRDSFGYWRLLHSIICMAIPTSAHKLISTE